jgi:hypothetical protein
VGGSIAFNDPRILSARDHDSIPINTAAPRPSLLSHARNTRGARATPPVLLHCQDYRQAERRARTTAQLS